MKYTTKVEINVPKSRAVELFENPDNMKNWQPSLISFEPFEGEPGKEGSKAKLRFKMGKSEMEMIETIKTNNLPDEFIAEYEARNVHNLIYCRFTEPEQGKTIWEMVSEFNFTGMMKLMGWLMPGMFKKQSQKDMENFKAFAEGSA